MGFLVGIWFAAIALCCDRSGNMLLSGGVTGTTPTEWEGAAREGAAVEGAMVLAVGGGTGIGSGTATKESNTLT